MRRDLNRGREGFGLPRLSLMEALLAKLRQGILGKDDHRKLYLEHQRHFSRRVRHLPRTFFPGAERSPDAITSLGNGAFVWFEKVGAFSGQPAFTYVIDRGLPVRPFLYFWRASATMRYLKEEGSRELKARCLVLRNVRIHLRQGFATRGDRGGERLWGLEEWEASRWQRRPARPVSALDVALTGARGKAAIRRILVAADAPLTRSEIAAVLLEHFGLNAPEELRVESIDPFSRGDGQTPETALEAEEIRARVREFHRGLTPRERDLLAARGYGESGKGVRSFRTVAKELPGRSAESYRLMERKILEAFRDHFDDPSELPRAAAALTSLIREETP